MKKQIKRVTAVTLVLILILLNFWIFTKNMVKAEGANVENEGENDVSVELNQSVEKYFLLDGEKTLLQQKLIVNMHSNEELEKQDEKVEMTLPTIQEKKPQDVIVLVNGKKLDSQSYFYNAENSVLQINVNKENNIKNWGKAQDIYKVIYNYENLNMEQSQTIELQANVRTKIINKDEIQTQNTTPIDLNIIGENITIQGKMLSEVYKGYLYNKEQKETLYKQDYQVEISNMQNTEEIKIEDKAVKYTYYKNQEDENSKIEMDANNDRYYKSTTLRKEQVKDILGENGKITIENENGELLQEITSQNQADENDRIVVNYEQEKVKKITIKILNPEQEGSIDIENEKALKTQYSKEQMQMITALEEIVGLKDIDAKLTMKLLEPQEQIKLEVNKKELSTIQANTDTQINITLKTNNQSENLYKNPIIEITMPEEVTQINLEEDINILYDEELIKQDVKVEGRKIIIYLSGEQTIYKSETIEGAVISIKANLLLNNKSTNAQKEIIVRCINDGKNVVETKKEINIVAPREMITVNKIEQLGVETLGENEKVQTKIPLKEAGKEFQVKSEIINNNNAKIENVSILGDMPTNTQTNENNLGVVLKSNLSLEGAEGNIYYTENKDANIDIENKQNGWTNDLNLVQNPSKYLVQIASLETFQAVNLTYPIEIPSNLDYNMKATEGYRVYYTNSETQITNNLDATYIEMTTGQGPIAEITLKAKIGGKEVSNNDTVKAGEVIKYEMEVRNTGTENITNATVIAPVPEGTKQVVPDDGEYGYEYTGINYYRELDVTQIEGTIDLLKVGETVTLTYEVRVVNDVQEGKQLSSTATLRYEEASKTSNQIDLIAQSGIIRLSMKRVKERESDLYEGSYIDYMFIVENISNEKQENIELKLNLPEQYEVETITINEEIPESEGEISGEIQESKDQLIIDSLDIGEKKGVTYLIKIKETIGQQIKIEFSGIAQCKNQQFRSNMWTETINYYKVKSSMVTSTNQYVKALDMIDYEIKLKNENDTKEIAVTVTDVLPKQLTLQSVTIDGIEMEKNNQGIIVIERVLQPQQEITIKILTKVDYDDLRNEAQTITNKATIEYGNKVEETNEVVHIIEANSDIDPDNPDPDNPDPDNPDPDNPDPDNPDPDNPDPDNPGPDNPKPDDSDDGNIATGTKMISGMAFNDENSNGQKDDTENYMENVKVKLINIKSGKYVKTKEGKELEATTDNNGRYILEKIAKGEYIVSFEYDDAMYKPTIFQKQGISEISNSNAIQKEININGETKNLTVTDTIKIEDDSISYINIGLIQLKSFNLKIDKYINRIIVQDSMGTTVREYNNTTLAKLELNSKTIRGTTIIIEYKLKITNQGELAGYARRVEDSLPSDLKFSSELNNQWYQQGNSMYTTALSNEKIEPGQTKELTLVATKTMTENNVGTTSNIAKITDAYNEQGIQNGDNSIGKAEVIISIKTGEIIMYVALIFINIILLIIVFVAIPKIKKVIKN